MSSSTPSRRSRGAVRLATLAVVVCAAQWVTASAAVAVPLPFVVVLPPTDRQVSVVVDVGANAQAKFATVVAGGVSQPTAVAPVLADQLAAALVVDASEPGRQALDAWLSGAARFALEAPAAARLAVIADTTPPVVVAGLQRGPMEVVGALSGIQARGRRSTSAALTLAMGQLPAEPTGPRVLVLYTSSPDAGGEAAAVLAHRLARAQTILVVVSTASDTVYWSEVTRATGGFLAPAEAPAIAPALDQVATTLRARYLVTFPRPGLLPTSASVRVETGDVTLTGEVVVPEATTGGAALDAPERDRGIGVRRALIALVAFALLVTTAMLVVAWRARTREQ